MRPMSRARREAWLAKLADWQPPALAGDSSVSAGLTVSPAP
jgi:hypothetical protein